jgi:hypothetical protein
MSVKRWICRKCHRIYEERTYIDNSGETYEKRWLCGECEELMKSQPPRKVKIFLSKFNPFGTRGKLLEPFTASKLSKMGRTLEMWRTFLGVPIKRISSTILPSPPEEKIL